MYSKTPQRLDELTLWARMKIKPSKSRSLSIRKGVRSDRTVFMAGGEKIPLLAEQPIRSLGRQYTSELSDRQMGRLVQKQLTDGLARIDNSQLPGKLKVWCYQFTLYQRIMWPLKVSEVPSSAASRMDGISNKYIRKWLGLPQCFSDAGLFGKNVLQLPLKSINIGYKQEKARLVVELKECHDQLVKDAKVAVRTGHKWKAQAQVDEAISRFQHKEVLGRVQHNLAGLGWGEPTQFWPTATREQRKTMVVEEVTQVEQERYLIKVAAQGRQGARTRWEDTTSRSISWTDIWRTPQVRLSFLIRAAYDTLPCPQNLSQWFGSEDGCPLCSKDNAGLQHILLGCKVALCAGVSEMAAQPGPEEAIRAIGEMQSGSQQLHRSPTAGHSLHPTRREAGEVSSRDAVSPACSWEGVGNVGRPRQAASLPIRDHPDNAETRCGDVVRGCQEGPHR